MDIYLLTKNLWQEVSKKNIMQYSEIDLQGC